MYLVDSSYPKWEFESVYCRLKILQDNPNPDWPPVKISSNKLCNGDYDRPLKVQVFDFDNDGKHDFIGEFFTTVNEVYI